MPEPDAVPSRIVVTGPSGWIGTAMLAHIARRLGPRWSGSVTLFGSSARSHRAPDGTRLDIRGLDEMGPGDLEGSILIHLAYLTREKADILGERVFTDTNLAIDDRVLDALRGANPKAVFVASSGAAALAADGRDRHPYGLCKLRQEDRFLAWAAGRETPLLAGRIFNLAGPYMNKVESYAIGSFAAQARRSGEIRVEARVPVFRSFLHVDDLCDLVVSAALKGIGRPRAIDLCGAEALEMGDIAQAVAARMGGGVAVRRDTVDPSRPSVYLGDFTHTKALAMELGIALTGFERQVEDTLEWMDSLSGGTAQATETDGGIGY